MLTVLTIRACWQEWLTGENSSTISDVLNMRHGRKTRARRSWQFKEKKKTSKIGIYKVTRLTYRHGLTSDCGAALVGERRRARKVPLTCWDEAAAAGGELVLERRESEGFLRSSSTWDFPLATARRTQDHWHVLSHCRPERNLYKTPVFQRTPLAI